MKRLLLACVLAAGFVCLNAETSEAQWSSSRSSSWSSSSSSRWSTSQGIGPNGYYSNTNRSQTNTGSFSTNRRVTTPWGGSNVGTSQQWGTRRTSSTSTGWGPNGFYNNRGGSFDSFNRGQNWNNNWRW